MTIQTKFNYRDEVFVMNENKPIRVTVIGINVLVNGSKPYIRYDLGKIGWPWSRFNNVKEASIGRTKEELFTLLCKDM